MTLSDSIPGRLNPTASASGSLFTRIVLLCCGLAVPLHSLAEPSKAAATRSVQNAKPAVRRIALERQGAVQNVGQGISIEFDASAAPDLDQWGRRAGEVCQEWFPKIVGLLPSDGFEPPASVRVVFAKNLAKGIGFSEGAQITLSAPYVRAHPEDVSLVIHELTHVVQGYKGGLHKPPTWLVEGIADYVRYFEYPGVAPTRRINLRTASYRDSYQTSASFLNWIQHQRDPMFAQRINACIRQGNYRETLFQQFTGETLDELWKHFTTALSGPTQGLVDGKIGARVLVAGTH